ncbi:Golgi apparatus membrane protein tvp18 [Gnomoniopsis smithogilvyi]|uniref:Golgi apparatus membrane protein tvp18 n=1 Tax=Gnomoniopsis smithogilvyi TaxID=1191159 RepID=A0A9W9CZW7_9PEZI|nr:Golgi apparatus membrane protein tvp18 [Gnomoniopsis smithogilvyi]
MTLKEEFATRNFSIYGQWLGVLSMILGFALGIANIFTFNLVIIIFCALLLASALIIVFIEIPLLLRICPTSSTFDAYVRKISTNYMRAAAYGVMGLVQWLSIIAKATSLIAEAIVLTATALCYLLAAVKHQQFVGSKTLGGAGVAQMIV